MSRKRRVSPEAIRGASFGQQAALDIISRRGCVFAKHQASDLIKNTRRRGSDAFDKAYAKAYAAEVNRCRR